MVIPMTGVFYQARKEPALRDRQLAGKLKLLTDRGTYQLPELKLCENHQLTLTSDKPILALHPTLREQGSSAIS